MGGEDAATRRGAVLRVVVGGLALVAFVLGLVGFGQLMPKLDPAAGVTAWTYVVYYTLQLFVLAAEPFAVPPRQLNVWLEIARVLAPATTALALLLTARTVLSSTYYAVRTRRFTGHTVVCGGGTAALIVARGVGDEGRTCVVIDGGDRRVAPQRHEGVADAGGTVVRIAGDPRDAEVLAAARVGQAREVVVVTGDGAQNADVAVAVRAALEDVNRRPRCFVEMGAPELAAALAAHEINVRSRVHVEFFDPAHHAARRLLDAHLPRVAEGQHVLVVGEGDLRDAVLDELGLRARRLGGEIATHTVPLDGADGLAPGRGVAVVVVCDEDDVQAARTGLRLAQRLAGTPVDVVVATASSTALGAVISGEDMASGTASRARLKLFNAAEHVYTLDALRTGLFVDIARAAHEDYRRRARERGEPIKADAPWDQLSDEYREANVDQALSIGEKLREIGCVAVPADDVRDHAGLGFAFEGNEVETLAEMEHERWCAERRRRGWTTGPRDDDAKTHPDLVGWEQLSEVSRSKDRDAVLDLPRQLELVGLRILRPDRTSV